MIDKTPRHRVPFQPAQQNDWSGPNSTRRYPPGLHGGIPQGVHLERFGPQRGTRTPIMRLHLQCGRQVFNKMIFTTLSSGHLFVPPPCRPAAVPSPSVTPIRPLGGQPPTAPPPQAHKAPPPKGSPPAAGLLCMEIRPGLYVENGFRTPPGFTRHARPYLDTSLAEKPTLGRFA